MKQLTDKQKEMVADMLSRTKSDEDINDFESRILGNAYGDKNTAKTYVELATMKLKLRR